MSRRLALVIATLGLGAAMALLLRMRGGGDAAPTVASSVPAVSPDDRHQPSPASLAGVHETSARSGATTFLADDRPTLGRVPHSPLQEPGDLVLVRVVEGPSSAPMADAEVSMQAGKHAAVYGVTNEQGEFDFSAAEVPARLGDSVSVVVKDEDGHERLRQTVVLGRDVLLCVPSKSVLHGEIALASGESPAWLYVSIWSPARGARGGETFVGYQNLTANGRFAIPALGEPPPDFIRLEVARTGLPVSLRMPTTELLVPPGPRIEVGLVLLQISVVDEDGEPVPEALVRCTAAGGAVRVDREGEEGFDDNLSVEPSTGLDGRTRLWVPSGPLSIVAGSKGYAPVRAAVHAEASTLDVVLKLRKLGESEMLQGSVAFEDGSPVFDAEVRGSNDDGSGGLARVSASVARSQSDGHFVLPIALDQDVEVQASDPVTRQAGVATWRPGDGPVRLVIDRGHPLVVRASEAPTAEPGKLGLIQVALVRERDQGQSVQTVALPVSFDHVPAGHWSVYALDRIHDRWARGVVFMTGAAAEDITLEFESLHYVVGRVDPPPGPGLRLTVEFTPNSWPARAVEMLLTADVAPDGTFRLPAPTAGELVLREDSRTIERRPAVGGGAPLVFVLPD
ncbi:MAG: hypothetical protein NTY35_11165 [Planctomycetota bacterium]|nr:hypothetical protein [Planctomycetota bacterium]